MDDSKDEMNDGVLPFLFRAFIESLLFSSSSLAIRFFSNNPSSCLFGGHLEREGVSGLEAQTIWVLIPAIDPPPLQPRHLPCPSEGFASLSGEVGVEFRISKRSLGEDQSPCC